MSKDPVIKRLSIPVEEDLLNRLSALIPWGQRYHVIAMMIEGLVDLLETNRDKRSALIGAIVTKDIPIANILDLTIKKNVDNRRSEEEHHGDE